MILRIEVAHDMKLDRGPGVAQRRIEDDEREIARDIERADRVTGREPAVDGQPAAMQDSIRSRGFGGAKMRTGTPVAMH